MKERTTCAWHESGGHPGSPNFAAARAELYDCVWTIAAKLNFTQCFRFLRWFPRTNTEQWSTFFCATKEWTRRGGCQGWFLLTPARSMAGLRWPTSVDSHWLPCGNMELRVKVLRIGGWLRIVWLFRSRMSISTKSRKTAFGSALATTPRRVSCFFTLFLNGVLSHWVRPGAGLLST